MKEVGLQARNDIDLQAFKLIRGKNIVGRNMAILRMISRHIIHRAQ